MRVPNAATVLAKDLRMGPRSPLLLWALLLPITMTLLVRGIFGSLFADEPTVGIVQEGPSALAREIEEAVEVVDAGDVDGLRADVEGGRLDAGVALPAGFDEAVRAGARPRLELWLSGASSTPERAVVTVAVLDAVRMIEAGQPPVDVEVVELGAAGLPLDVRLLPVLVIMAVAIAGGMVPAASLVEERERGTLSALLVSPTSMDDVLLAKATLGVLLAMATGLVTLALNDAFGGAALATVLGVALGALMMAELGLLLGTWAPDTNTLFAAWKGGALLLVYPVVVFLWPDLPRWIGQIGPTYYFLEPIFAVSVEGADLGDVAGNLLIGVVICLALLPAVAAAGRRLQRRLAAGRRPRGARRRPAPAG